MVMRLVPTIVFLAIFVAHALYVGACAISAPSGWSDFGMSATAAGPLGLGAYWRGQEYFIAKTQRLSQRPLAECPEATLPKRLRPYLLRFDADGQPSGLHADRYEFWLYRQIRKRLKSGELYLDDSLQHRCFSDELVSLDAKADVLSQMDIPWLRRPIETQLNALATELPAPGLARANQEQYRTSFDLTLPQLRHPAAQPGLRIAMRSLQV